MLEIDNFKNAIMQPNTKRAKEIRLYHSNLEGAFFSLHTTQQKA